MSKQKKSSNQFVHGLSFVFVYLFYLPFQFLSYQNCIRLGRLITRSLYPFAKKHRRIATENIRYAFPDWDEERVNDLVKKHFNHLGILLAHTLWAPRMDKKWMKTYLLYDQESLAIEEEVKAEGVGVVLISGHLGTWEILVQFMGIRMKGAGLYKKIRNPFVDRLLFKMRSNNGMHLVPVDDSTKAIRLLKQGYWIGFGSDQNAGKNGIFVQFLNRPASTFTGPALMAFLSGSRLLYYSVLAGPNGRVLVRVKDLGYVEKDKFENKEALLKYYTELWTRTLESEIKLFPEQYFWVHRRWRTQPGDFQIKEVSK